MMNDIVIRRAIESDKNDIARTIVYGFRFDFIRLSKNLDKVVDALASSIDFRRFFIARNGSQTIGVIACADCNGRAINIDIKQFRKYLGLFKGSIAGSMLKTEFSKPLQSPLTTGNIDVVSVAENFRRMGLAGKMLDTVINQTEYNEYILDVVDSNISAQKCYLKYGFC